MNFLSEKATNEAFGFNSHFIQGMHVCVTTCAKTKTSLYGGTDEWIIPSWRKVASEDCCQLSYGKTGIKTDLCLVVLSACCLVI